MFTFGTLKAKPGQYVFFDVFDWPVRVSNIITSWTTKICRVENDGTLTRVN